MSYPFIRNDFVYISLFVTSGARGFYSYGIPLAIQTVVSDGDKQNKPEDLFQYAGGSLIDQR
jgi:hypothetical protein